MPENILNLPIYMLEEKKIDNDQELMQSGPEVIKLFSCSTQLSMNFFLLINIGILTFMSGKIAF